MVFLGRNRQLFWLSSFLGWHFQKFVLLQISAATSRLRQRTGCRKNLPSMPVYNRRSFHKRCTSRLLILFTTRKTTFRLHQNMQLLVHSYPPNEFNARLAEHHRNKQAVHGFLLLSRARPDPILALVASFLYSTRSIKNTSIPQRTIPSAWVLVPLKPINPFFFHDRLK